MPLVITASSPEMNLRGKVLVLGTAMGFFGPIVVELLTYIGTGQTSKTVDIAILIAVITGANFVWFIRHQNISRAASLLLLLVSPLVAVVIVADSGFVAPSYIFTFFLIMFAGFMLGRGSAVALASSAACFLLFLTIAHQAKWLGLVPLSQLFDRSLLGFICILFTLSAVILYEHERKIYLRRLDHQSSTLVQLRSAIDALALVSTSDRAGRITEVNDTLCRISGYVRTDLIGRSHNILKSGHHSPEFFAEMWRTIAAGNPWRGEICNRAKSGKVYWVDGTIVPIRDTDGKISEYLSIRYDITDRKETELRLLQAAKMASLGEMAGGIAHEINTPLAIIESRARHIGRASQTIGTANSAQITEWSEIIFDTAERIAKIVRGLRDFSRDASNDRFELTRLSAIVDNALALCSEKFKERGVELRVDVPENAGSIECRAAQIEQVLLNLISNAIDAVESLPNAWVSLQVRPSGNEVLIAVSDCGKGIAQNIVDRIMEPFFTTKEVGKGTGLGLSISAGLLTSHQGSLTVDRDCANTCFVVTLPRAHHTKVEKAA